MAKRFGLVISLLLLPLECLAQTTIHVAGEHGVGIAGAAVEVWGPTKRLAHASTDSVGIAQIMVPSEATGIYVARVGFKSVVRTLPSDSSLASLSVRLESFPIPLSALVVEPAPRCPVEDEATAREVWLSASTRYRSLGSKAVQTRLWFAESRVEHRSLGIVPSGNLRGPASIGSAARHRAAWEAWVAKDGYARRLKESSFVQQAYEAWEYAPLGGELAHHFADSAFGDLHTFSVVSDSEAGWILKFCPIRADIPEIQGTLEISPNYVISAANWSFSTPEFDENAGGRAIFSISGSVLPLLPVEAFYWREIAGNVFYQRYLRYNEWLVSDGFSSIISP